jgi:hypothetical protein
LKADRSRALLTAVRTAELPSFEFFFQLFQREVLTPSRTR